MLYYFNDFNYFLLFRLVSAVIMGGIIGFERGGNKHDAGLRTHIIVCLGAASVMVLSECLIKQYNINSEIMRMGAQVISGVGFLGVGSIIVDGNRVRGITTAAGLWTTACIGLAVGSGYYIIAFTVVILVLFTNLGLRSLTLKLQTVSAEYKLKIELSDREVVKYVLKRLLDEGIDIKLLKIKENDDNDKIIATLEIKVPRSIDMGDLISEINNFKGVTEFMSL